MILYALIFVPVVFALLIAARPVRDARQLALIGTLLPVGLVAWLLFSFDWDLAAQFQFPSTIPWFTALGGIERGDVALGGVQLSVGVDSVSLMLVALTVLLGPICVAGSFSAITERVKTYYAWLVALQGAMTAVFLARDLVLFYVAFEFTLVPMWVLISLWGSTNRRKAATRFFLYTFTGSMIALAGLVYVVWTAAGIRGYWTFDIGDLSLFARLHLTASEQAWVMLALLAGFAVKVPLFPVHTWLPLAHTEAPTAGSVILAGVLLKLGTYGIYRFVLPFCPIAAWEYAPTVAAVSIVGIVYAGLICWVQTDVKKLVAYSSVAHLGFCILGMFSFNTAGLTGSVLYMVNHGLSTGALFLMIGMVYERYHTRSMKELGGLASRMPVWATFMVFFTLASVGLPGLNGFVSEFLCLMGAFQSNTGIVDGAGATSGRLGPWYAAIAGTGMIVAAMYLLLMVGHIVWGPLREPHGHAAHHEHGHDEGRANPPGAETHGSPLPRDLSWREIGILIPLAVACIALGVFPKPLLDGLKDPVNAIAAQVVGAGVKARTAGLPPAQEAAP
ncbi:MAG: NADH-quinone oxidoreductase subunit M [Phycisphaerales bacterium]